MLTDLYSKPHNKHYLDRYVRFIETRRGRKLEGYVEKHHILPKSKTMFPNYKNSKWNFIELTPREHFTAHHLLWKAYRNQSTGLAFFKMSYSERHKGYIHSRKYAELKEEMLVQSIEKGKQNLDKMLAANRGTKWYNNGTEERRLKEPLEGWILGKLRRSEESYAQQGRQGLKYYNNGVENRKFVEPPDDSWSPGMKPQGPRKPRT